MRRRAEFPMTAHWMAYEDDAVPVDTAGDAVPCTEIAFRSMLYRNWFHTSSVVLRRDLPQRFAPDKRYGEDLWAMETAELATFRRLWRDGLIGIPLLCALFAWSLMRFLRRLLLVAMGRRILPAQ